MANKSRDSLPKTVREAIEGMAPRLDPGAAVELQATIQFNVSPSASLNTGGDYYLSIANGKCDFSIGTTPDPTLTIATPADVWLKIARKEMSGAVALLSGKYKARGKISLLMKLDKLFSRQPFEVMMPEKQEKE